MKTGEKIKELRKEKNLTQGELAKNLMLTQDTISRIEKGNREVSNSELVTIAKFFGVSSDYILGLTEHKTALDSEEGEIIRAAADYMGLDEKAITAMHNAMCNLIYYGICTEEEFPWYSKYFSEILSLIVRYNSLFWSVSQCYIYVHEDATSEETFKKFLENKDITDAPRYALSTAVDAHMHGRCNPISVYSEYSRHLFLATECTKRIVEEFVKPEKDKFDTLYKENNDKWNALTEQEREKIIQKVLYPHRSENNGNNTETE